MASINSIFTSSGPQSGQFEAGAVAALLGAEMSIAGRLGDLVPGCAHRDRVSKRPEVYDLGRLFISEGESTFVRRHFRVTPSS
jgi:hypothetical protein